MTTAITKQVFDKENEYTQGVYLALQANKLTGQVSGGINLEAEGEYRITDHKLKRIKTRLVDKLKDIVDYAQPSGGARDTIDGTTSTQDIVTTCYPIIEIQPNLNTLRYAVAQAGIDNLMENSKGTLQKELNYLLSVAPDDSEIILTLQDKENSKRFINYVMPLEEVRKYLRLVKLYEGVLAFEQEYKDELVNEMVVTRKTTLLAKLAREFYPYRTYTQTTIVCTDTLVEKRVAEMFLSLELPFELKPISKIKMPHGLKLTYLNKDKHFKETTEYVKKGLTEVYEKLEEMYDGLFEGLEGRVEEQAEKRDFKLIVTTELYDNYDTFLKGYIINKNA